MMQLILRPLGALAVAMIVNLLLGTYYNINLDQCCFNKKTFLTGVAKAGIIAIAFIGLAFCFDSTNLSEIGVTPDLIMNAAVVLYVGKATTNLMKILGVTNLTGGGVNYVHNQNVQGQITIGDEEQTDISG